MVQEMHAILIKSTPRVEEPPMRMMPGEGPKKRMMLGGETPYRPLSIAAYSMSGSPSGDSPAPVAEYRRKVPSVSLYATSDLPHRAFQARTVDPSPTKPSATLDNHSELPDATVKLNNERRAFGAKEYEAFKQRYAQPKKVSKPSFLKSVTPNHQELQACIPYIFRSTAEGKQQTQELKQEISRWTQEFSRFVNSNEETQKNKDEFIMALLVALNEAVDSSSGRMRQLFYETSGSAGFAAVLQRVETISKSVRVMKEIEEFEDTKEEWEQSGRSR
jgi:hypothetical protein